MRNLCLLHLAVLGTALPCFAQTPAQQTACNSTHSRLVNVYCRNLANEFAAQTIAKGSASYNGVLFYPLTETTLLVPALIHTVYADFVIKKADSAGASAIQSLADNLAQLASTKAATPQAGSNPNASASTSLTQKPTTTDFISLAAESGAFINTVNGTTATAKANVNGLRRYFSSKPFSSLNPTAADALQHLTLSATFNIEQGGSTAAPVSGQATSTTPSNIGSVLLPSNNVSFNSLTVSWQIVRPYTPTSDKFRKAWESAITNAGAQQSISDDSTKLFKDFLKAVPSAASIMGKPDVSAALSKWKERAAADELAGDFPAFLEDFQSYMLVVITSLESENGFDDGFLAVAADLEDLQSVRDTILDQARGSFFTVTYSYSTPKQEPATHDATAIFAFVTKKRDAGAQLSANFSGSWFASIPQSAMYGRLKDYQISGEFDQPIGNPNDPRAVFSLAGYGQYQYAPNVLNVSIANTVPGTNIAVPSGSQVFTSSAGWLGVAQSKLTFNVGKGATIPIAVKWSNKTDLLTDSNWKGQFGLSYDLSALKSVLGSK